MREGTWVQFEKEAMPFGVITRITYDNKYLVTVFKTNLTLVFDMDGYSCEFERKNKINRLVEYRA